MHLRYRFYVMKARLWILVVLSIATFVAKGTTKAAAGDIGNGEVEHGGGSMPDVQLRIQRADGSELANTNLKHPQNGGIVQDIGPDASLMVILSQGPRPPTSIVTFSKRSPDQNLALNVSCQQTEQAVLLGIRSSSGNHIKASMPTLLQHFHPELQLLQGGQAGKGIRIGPNPVIEHKFRTPEKRPPEAIAGSFAVATILPLAFLAYSWSTVGVNLKGLPRQGAQQLSALGFHLSLFAIIVLYTAFWLQLNLLQTLPILAVLGLCTAATGYHALRSQNVSRQKQK